MAKKTFMRVDQDLLNQLKLKKIAQRESYSDVVKRMIDNEVKVDYSHDAVMQRIKAKAGARWNRKKGRAGQSFMPSGF